jgi:hypothetical protein
MNEDLEEQLNIIGIDNSLTSWDDNDFNRSLHVQKCGNEHRAQHDLNV